MKIKTKMHHVLVSIGLTGLMGLQAACTEPNPIESDFTNSESGDTGDGDGDTGDGDGDTGDGDGDTGDGDGDTGDGDGDTGDGDGDTGDGDGDAPVCGDGNIDPNESCDDGNQDNTDACLNTCEQASCGDGFVEEDVEECDNVVNNAEYGEEGCAEECEFPPYCGDGEKNGPEECDGNDLGDDTCEDPHQYDGGDLACYSNCTANVEGCFTIPN